MSEKTSTEQIDDKIAEYRAAIKVIEKLDKMPPQIYNRFKRPISGILYDIAMLERAKNVLIEMEQDKTIIINTGTIITVDGVNMRLTAGALAVMVVPTQAGG